jgi:hypothetical protein
MAPPAKIVKPGIYLSTGRFKTAGATEIKIKFCGIEILALFCTPKRWM